jgi:hypothetical protein
MATFPWAYWRGLTLSREDVGGAKLFDPLLQQKNRGHPQAIQDLTDGYPVPSL